MLARRHVMPPVLAVGLLLARATGYAQQPKDSTTSRVDSVTTSPTPPWRDSVRYGGGPSVGAPPSDYTGAKPPAEWCLRATRRAPGDFGYTGAGWTEASRSWLRQVLSDTTDHGAGWRKVLGGAPQLTPNDSIVQVTDEQACELLRVLANPRLQLAGVARPGSARRLIAGGDQRNVEFGMRRPFARS